MYNSTLQLVIFLHIFTAPCMCPKIDMMERECKKLEFEGDLNGPLIIKSFTEPTVDQTALG
jgi:hypothetical protein